MCSRARSLAGLRRWLLQISPAERSRLSQDHATNEWARALATGSALSSASNASADAARVLAAVEASGSGSSGRQQTSFKGFPFVKLSLLPLWAFWGVSVAACDSQPATNPSEAVASLWSTVVDDIQRADAHLPPGIPITELRAPAVTEQHGRGCTVRLTVREGVDLRALERTLCSLQDGGPIEGGRTRGTFFSSSKIAVRSAHGGREVCVSHGTASRDIVLRIPSAYSREPPSIAVSKAGALTASDLSLLSQLMACANDLQLHRRVPGGAQRPHSLADPFGLGDLERGAPFDRFEGLGTEVSGAMERFLSGMLRDLEQGMLADAGDHEDGMDERAAQLPQLRTPRDRSDGRPSAAVGSLEAQAQQLEQLGARVYLPDAAGELSWEQMAGYDDVKGLIEDIVLLSVTDSSVYEGIAKRTRRDGKAQRPKAVLFEGPPGTGKTTSARIIAKQAAVPLVYIPLESIVSKWYGESERNLAAMLALAEGMGGCIIFLDEVDSLATSRDDGLNEGTRRILGTLLRFIDGFEATRSIVVAATNRKQDLDAALLSRCDAIIRFALPDAGGRAAILRHYAAHLTDAELAELADETGGMSARDLRAVCEVTERRWVSAIIKGRQQDGTLPPLEAYMASAQARLQSLSGSEARRRELQGRLLQSLGRHEAHRSQTATG